MSFFSEKKIAKIGVKTQIFEKFSVRFKNVHEPKLQPKDTPQVDVV